MSELFVWLGIELADDVGHAQQRGGGDKCKTTRRRNPGEPFAVHIDRGFLVKVHDVDLITTPRACLGCRLLRLLVCLEGKMRDVALTSVFDDCRIDEVRNDSGIRDVLDAIEWNRTRTDPALGTEQDPLCSVPSLGVRDPGRPSSDRAVEHTTLPPFGISSRQVHRHLHATGIRLAEAVACQQTSLATRPTGCMELGLLTVGSVLVELACLHRYQEFRPLPPQAVRVRCL